jgi:hypothetical protein
MSPPVALGGHLDPGAAPDLLHGDRQYLVDAVGRAMTLACEDSGGLIIGYAVVRPRYRDTTRTPRGATLSIPASHPQTP